MGVLFVLKQCQYLNTWNNTFWFILESSHFLVKFVAKCLIIRATLLNIPCYILEKSHFHVMFVANPSLWKKISKGIWKEFIQKLNKPNGCHVLYFISFNSHYICNNLLNRKFSVESLWSSIGVNKVDYKSSFL